MALLRSGTLAAWATAWMSGEVAFDHVVDVVTGSDAPHLVSGLPGAAGPVSLGAALIEWRSRAQEVALVLPVPGDVRGVPGPRAFLSAALDAGEAVHGGRLGLVPVVRSLTPSSAPPSVVWHAHELDDPPVDHLDPAEAEHDLAVAMRETASLFRAADLTGTSSDVSASLIAARRASEKLELPPGFSPRGAALLAQAERLTAILQIAESDPQGGAVDRSGVGTRADALRSLATVVRRARIAGYNAGTEHAVR